MRLYFPTFKQLPKTTQKIIAICVVMYIITMFFGRLVIPYLGLVPYAFTHEYYFWQPFTYMFLHGGFWHLFGNMFMFWMVGPVVERVLGSKGMWRFVFVTGVFAGLCQTVLGGINSFVPIVGISGVIFGLFAAFGLFYPNQTIYVYFIFPMKTKYFVILLLVTEILLSFSHTSMVANLAHLGGLVAGYFYLSIPFWILRRRVREVKNVPVYSRAELDRILDKVAKSGMESLTKKEIEYLNFISGRS